MSLKLPEENNIFLKKQTLQAALKRSCPRCNKGHIFKGPLTIDVIDQCPHCGLLLAENDSGDGPAVFMIFILGFLLIPLSIWLEIAIAPALWVHIALFGGIGLALCIGAMQPLKALVIALEYTHRPHAWEAAPKNKIKPSSPKPKKKKITNKKP